MNVLVLCTGNSARSVLLESILNQQAGSRVSAWSAGSHPRGEVHPAALALLARLGHPTDHLRSKSWDEFATETAPRMACVITVCDAAARETCPQWPGAPVQSHWGIADPAEAPQDVWEPAFEEAYATLAHRAKLFLDLGFESMEPGTLKQHLDHIGTLP